MEVLSPFRKSSMCRHVHRALTRNKLLDLTTIVPATACHQKNYVGTYSRFTVKRTKHRSGADLSFPQAAPASFDSSRIRSQCACRGRQSPLNPQPQDAQSYWGLAPAHLRGKAKIPEQTASDSSALRRLQSPAPVRLWLSPLGSAHQRPLVCHHTQALHIPAPASVHHCGHWLLGFRNVSTLLSCARLRSRCCPAPPAAPGPSASASPADAAPAVRPSPARPQPRTSSQSGRRVAGRRQCESLTQAALPPHRGRTCRGSCR